MNCCPEMNKSALTLQLFQLKKKRRHLHLCWCNWKHINAQQVMIQKQTKPMTLDSNFHFCNLQLSINYHYHRKLKAADVNGTKWILLSYIFLRLQGVSILILIKTWTFSIRSPSICNGVHRKQLSRDPTTTFNRQSVLSILWKSAPLNIAYLHK